MPKVFIVPHFIEREPHPEEASEFYSHCVGVGWQKLLLELTDKLFYLGWNGGLDQVKEKFGTLHFYWRNNIEDSMKNEIAEDLVELTERKTANICEECGKYGKTRGDGWLRTACDKCWNKRLEKRRKQADERNITESGGKNEDAVPHPVS